MAPGSLDLWGDLGESPRVYRPQDLHDSEEENKAAYEKLIKAKRFLTAPRGSQGSMAGELHNALR